MTPYRVTPAALADMDDIWRFIAADNPVAADKLEDDLHQAFTRLAAAPSLGHSRRDLTGRSVKFLTVRKNYLVVYDPIREHLEILRVLHGARDAKSLLDDA